MKKKLSSDVLSQLPHFNDKVIIQFPKRKGIEFEMTIFEKGSEGSLVIHQQQPKFNENLLGEIVNVIYSTKFVKMGKEVKGVITKLNKKYILIALYGDAKSLPERRMDKRFPINRNLVSLKILNKKYKSFYFNTESVNISNTGLRFSYERCKNCSLHKDPCVRHLNSDDEVIVELSFKTLERKISVDGIVARADKKNADSLKFYVGIKFNCDSSKMNDISKSIRELEAKELNRKYTTRLLGTG